MKTYLFTTLLSLLFVGITISGVEAQSTATSISGDEICGAASSTKCGVQHIGIIMGGVLRFILGIGTPLLFIFIAYRVIVAWFALRQGNANAYKDALAKAGNAIIGFIILVALFGGLLYVMLSYLGVREAGGSNPLNILRLFSEAFIPHAYAQSAPTSFLPNYLGVDNLYDFILSVLRLVMRFFIYPALIVIWVWTGFAFVAAQGNPEALAKAKKWLMWALITTFIMFFMQTFLLALRGSVQRILPASATEQTGVGQTGTVDGRVAPAVGAPGAACTTSTGATGQTGSDGSCLVGRGASFQAGAACTTSTGAAGIMGGGVCNVGRGGGSNNTATYCTGRTMGTLCTTSGNRVGTCSSSEGVAAACNAATQGDVCINGSGVYGTIDATGSVCELGQRPLAGVGGSCRANADCGGRGALTCVNNICQ